jgi:predicted O-methyltransferase YrrM
MIPKALQLLSLLPQSPGEFYDRVLASLQTHWDACFISGSYRSCSRNELVSQLSEALNHDVAAKLQERELAEIESNVAECQRKMPTAAPFSRFHNAGSLLARICYAVTRALQPEVVLESGVCYGVTSAHFLQALERNGHGQLHSVDLPPLGKNGDAYVGALVPRDLWGRWTLHRGASRRLLRPLIERLGHIDVFLHDSLHTSANMRWEFTTVWPVLRPGGVLIADDVERNAAFRELSQRKDVRYTFVVQETNKESMFGIAVKCS